MKSEGQIDLVEESLQEQGWLLAQRRLFLWGSLAGVLLVILLAGTVLLGARARGLSRQEPIEETRIPVKTVHPKLLPQFIRTIKEPAYVEAYEEARLFAQVAGQVKRIDKNIGDLVTEGEVLVEIDVPELQHQVA